MAIEAYAYGHFPIVAGVIAGTVGVEVVLAHAGEGEPLGLFYAAALYRGFALYLAGHLLFKQRVHAALSVPRVAAVGALCTSRSRRRRSCRRSSDRRGWCSSSVF
jgi:low temperature requirement protein LtrA